MSNKNSEPSIVEYAIVLILVVVLVIGAIGLFFGSTGALVADVFGIELGSLPTLVFGIIIFYGGKHLWNRHSQNTPQSHVVEGEIVTRQDTTGIVQTQINSKNSRQIVYMQDEEIIND